ncbi:putative basic proline-rich protein-like [Iris pallida]|uniref:Basic proline-rich protein-like n=1 Tax=Iris pallida TaxID=29817 RepID=A0AAX6DHC8_IRIPA|nr:putative basic proline-rich protein-like [Iris pallida]
MEGERGMGKSEGGFHLGGWCRWPASVGWWIDAREGGAGEGERGGDGWSERRRIRGRRGRRTPVEAVARPAELGLPEEGGGGTGCGARRSWVLHRGWSPIGEVGEVGGARRLLEGTTRRKPALVSSGQLGRARRSDRSTAGGRPRGRRKKRQGVPDLRGHDGDLPVVGGRKPRWTPTMAWRRWRLATVRWICVGDDRRAGGDLLGTRPG